MQGFTDITSGEARRGYIDITLELQQKFPNPEAIEKIKIKKSLLNCLVNT